ncbi:MAG: glycoside hydrolase [Bacteroidota bacterium]|nr:glycoside hydrolase [Bacteroidota bacterium]
MKSLSIKIIPFLLLSVISSFAQIHKNFQSIALQPTIAYIKYKGQNCRVARVTFNNGKIYQEARATISFNGLKDSVIMPETSNGQEFFEIPLPGVPVKVAVQANVTLKTSGQVYMASCIVEPAKDNWSVYVLPHSHVDIGYTNTQAKVLKLHMSNIDESIKLAEKTQNYPEEARFKWTTEAMWVVDNYLKAASPEKKDRFWNAVKKGWISLDGAYGNTNTSMTDSRQLMQLFAKSQNLAKEHGIEIHTMFQGDVPGASWGLAAQSEQTGIRYFLSGPNASDRIGNLPKWQDKPFYWVAPSGREKILFWQCQPYSIGYSLKGTKIPNFFTVEDPKPYYTGHPSENFLNPYIFEYLEDLEQKNFPYNMSIITWAMSDNAPIDPELPDAVRLWNEHYSSPKLIITSTKQFFNDFEKKYKEKIPYFAGDYTEYWTDGVSSAAKETALSRQVSDQLKQADAIWAIRNLPTYPEEKFDDTWKNLLLYNEHTWGAYNSVSEPDNGKVKSEWAVKQSYVLNAKKMVDSLTGQSLKPISGKKNAVDVYNTVSWSRTGLVYVPADISKVGDLVKDATGNKVPSQRLTTGELAFAAENVPQFGKKTYTINAGRAFAKGNSIASLNSLSNGIYKVEINDKTGNITRLSRTNSTRNYIQSDSAGFNEYVYMSGDSLKQIKTDLKTTVTIKENGPLVVSLLIKSTAAGTDGLTREVRLVSGIDGVELINTINKKAVRNKESIHFAFPFNIPNAQVRYSIPWGSVNAESEQFPNSNRNWYTVQRWVDISNSSFGVTWSTPDAPLFEIGKYNLLADLHESPEWAQFTPQNSLIYSWVMNNIWHTNFKADQEGTVSFRYFIKTHDGGYNNDVANQTGIDDHQPLMVTSATENIEKGLFFNLSGKDVYVEAIKPAKDGKGVVLQLVSTGDADAMVNISPRDVPAVKVWESNITEDRKSVLKNNFMIHAKSVLSVRIEQ